MKSRMWFYRGLLIGLMIGFWVGAELFLKPAPAVNIPQRIVAGCSFLYTAAVISPLASNSARIDGP